MASMETLWPDHVLFVMVQEHIIIMQNLNRLYAINQELQSPANDSLASETEQELKDIADLLMDAESHHQREEQVLFPQMNLFGLDGIATIMCEEHQLLREHKHKLSALLQTASQADFAQFKSELNELANFLVHYLHDHIQKENTIAYPEALQAIDDDALWAEMKQACDEIGYCKFTPAT